MAGYTRQDTGNNISNGSVIDADVFDAEYNAVEAAFNASTGHSHDGTAGEGSPITKVGPSQNLVVSATALTPKTTNTLDLGTASIQFKNAWFDGTVDTDTLIVSANATVGGTLGVTGVINATGGLSGNITGNVTGDLTGDVTGTVSDVSNHTTDDITEGFSNLYHTTARVRTAISATGNLGYNSTTGVLSYTQGNTDTVAEGSTNLYYTTARATTDAKSAISVVDAGGDGSLSYNAGVITYTGPSASEVRAHFSAGTGVTYSSGQFSIGQAVGTTSNVSFGSLTLSGNLIVNGTTTTVNSNTVNIGDNIIVLNADEAGTPSQNAGFEVERGTSPNKSVLWDEANDRWTVGGETFVASTFLGNLSGNATTASSLQTSRSITLTGDVSGTSLFSGASNTVITATVVDNSHNHTIGNVTGLQAEIDTKAELAGSSGQNFSANTLTATTVNATTVGATTVDLGAWTVTQSGTDLKFAYNGTNRMKLDAAGNLTVTGDVTGFGTV